MRWLSPSKKTLDAVLKDEDNSNSIVDEPQYQEVKVESYLALNRRKLVVINGSEKLGRLIYLELLTSVGRSNSSISSSGTTCCSSLRRRHLAFVVL